MKKKYIFISIVALLVTFILLTLFVHPSPGKGTVSDFEELVRKGDVEHIIEMIERTSITRIEIRDNAYPLYIIRYGDSPKEAKQFPYCSRLTYKEFFFDKARKTNYFYLDERIRTCIERTGGNVAEVKYLIDFLEMFEMYSIYFYRDENAIYFELVEDGRSYAFRYSFNKVSDGDSNGSNIKKINDNWLLIADE